MRPQLLAFFLFSASLWILSTRHTHPRRCWALVGIAVVWANFITEASSSFPSSVRSRPATISSEDIRDGEGWPGSPWGAP